MPDMANPALRVAAAWVRQEECRMLATLEERAAERELAHGESAVASQATSALDNYPYVTLTWLCFGGELQTF